MNKRVVIYTRQSNIQDGNLRHQIRACTVFARDNKWDIYDVLEDKGTGQSRLFDRDKGRLLSEIIQSGEVDIVLAKEISRFTRDRNGDEDLKMVRNLVTAKGIELHFVKEGKIDNTWEGDKQLLHGSMDSHDFIQTVRTNTLDGKYSLLEQGVPVWVGQTLYGYDRKYRDINAHKRQSYMVVNPAQGSIVTEIFARFASGENARSIAEDLNTRGVMSPDEVKPERKGHAPNTWNSAHVLSMVPRELYKGLYNFGKFETVTIQHYLDEGQTIKELDDNGKHKITKSRRQRPAGDKDLLWYEFELPELQLVSPEVWGKCQELLKQNKKQVRKTTSPYLLTGRVSCDRCGAPYKGSSRGTKDGQTNYYRNSCECGAMFRADELEPVIWAQILNFVYSDDNVRASIERIEAGDPEHSARLQSNISDLTAQIEDKTRQIKSTAKTIPLLVGLAHEETVKILNTLSNELVTLESKRGELTLETETVTLDEETILERVRVIRGIADGANFDRQKQIINLLDVRVHLITLTDEEQKYSAELQGVPVSKKLFTPRIQIALLDNVVQSSIIS